MAENIPYLCGGIFFSLVLQARKNRSKARNKFDGGSDGLTDSDLMKGLIYVVTGQECIAAGTTLRKCTSEYKACQINGNTYIPFADNSTRRAFTEEVNCKNPATFNRMAGFVDKYLNSSKHDWLVRALLEVIHDDETIGSDTEFMLDISTMVSKKDIYGINHIEIEPFLISVIVCFLNFKRDNTLGQKTFNEWFERESERSAWNFNSDIGSRCSAQFKIQRMNPCVFSDEPNSNHRNYDHSNMAGIILNTDKTAPDLSNFDFENLYVIERTILEENTSKPFKCYLQNSIDFFSYTKTLLYSEKPRLFDAFYVCNDLRLKPIWRQQKDKIIPDACVTGLEKLSRYIIISGTGGIGKSMMMKHLFLDTASKYDRIGRLPVMISLKNIDTATLNLFSVIVQAISAFDPEISDELVNAMLVSGRCVLLFDGLDEVPTVARSAFEKMMSELCKQYPKNFYVISSRPTSSFISYTQFTVLEILPFSKNKALELIDKLDFYDSEAKIKFRNDLSKNLYASHQQFASNPLLLTIMLMTYSAYGDVPAKRHVFYAKAYETMSRLHDATKGAYVRPMHTKLTPEDFAGFFSEFCARTYKAELFEFSENRFCEYMNKVIRSHPGKIDASAYDFLSDLTENLCIMYEEGGKYHFIHRSFQEYFSAVFFSNQTDDRLEVIGEFFDSQRSNNYSDRTFDMMYDMIPEKIDRYIFLPYLETLWKTCDLQEGYLTFLNMIYPTIYSYSGSVGEFFENEPDSFLYNFIVNEKLLRYNGQLDDIDYPVDAERFMKAWTTIDEVITLPTGKLMKNRKECLVEDVSDEYIDVNGEPEIEGFSWEIDIHQIMENRIRFDKLIAFISDDAYPLKKEYNSVRRYTEELRTKVNLKSNADDWFDNF